MRFTAGIWKAWLCSLVLPPTFAEVFMSSQAILLYARATPRLFVLTAIILICSSPLIATTAGDFTIVVFLTLRITASIIRRSSTLKPSGSPPIRLRRMSRWS